jgi:hypothetical protein
MLMKLGQLAKLDANPRLAKADDLIYGAFGFKQTCRDSTLFVAEVVFPGWTWRSLWDTV